MRTTETNGAVPAPEPAGVLRAPEPAGSRGELPSSRPLLFPHGPPHALALFRIGFATMLLLRYAHLAPHVELLLSCEGIVMPRGFPFADGPGVGLAWLAYATAVLSTVGVLLGLVTRVSTTLCAAAFVYHYAVYFSASNFSFDALFAIVAVLLALSPCGAALSLDSRSGRAAPGRVHLLWAQRMICVCVAMLYFGTGLFKLSSQAWSSGDVIQWNMVGDWSTGLSHWLVRRQIPVGVFDAVAIGTTVFELCMPWLLFRRTWLPVAALLGTSFHLGIWLLHDIWEFMVVPMTYVLFVDPPSVERWLQTWRSRLLRWRVRGGRARGWWALP